MKPGSICKLQTIKRAMNSYWSDHWHSTKIQSAHI